MKKLLKFTLLLGIVWVFIGCSGSYGVMYDTKPRCAKIICGGEFQGYSPVTLYYNKDNIDDNDILHTQQCKAIFASGYEGNFSNSIDTNQYPDGVHGIITRPQGVGYSQDVEFLCSNTCIYEKARNHWKQFSYTYSKQGKSVDDVFLEFKRSFYYSGTCP